MAGKISGLAAPSPPDSRLPFGAETRRKLLANDQAINADIARQNAVLAAMLMDPISAQEPAAFNDEGLRRPVTPYEAAPQDLPPVNLFEGANSYFADPSYQPETEASAMVPPADAAPTPPAPPAPPKPTPRPTRSHTIREGDNPSTIARRYGMTLDELEAKNPGILKRARRLQIGTKVVL